MTEPVPSYVNQPYQPVHGSLPSTYQWQGLSDDQIKVLRARLIESIIQVVVQAVKGIFIPGGGVGGALEQFVDMFNNIGEELFTDFIEGDWPNFVSTFGGAITSLQQLIDSLAGGLTGTTTTNNDLSTVGWGLINQVLGVGPQIVSQLFGTIATLQAQLQSIQGQVTSLVDDFATTTVAGYTNLVGTLAISSTGPYIQASTLTAAYRTASLATNKHGAQIVIAAKQQGSAIVAISSDTAAANYAGVRVYSGFHGDSLQIVTGSSPTDTVVRQEVDYSGESRLQNDNAIDIWYDPAPNTFYVLRNGQPAVSWWDSTNVVTHDASHRKAFIVTNADDQSDSGYWGPGIRRVSVYDK